MQLNESIFTDSIEEALQSQKFYSDYFSTTETETVVPTPAPALKIIVRKKKNVAQKKVETSESEDDQDQGKPPSLLYCPTFKF